jgi:hypothetical protein
MVDQNIKMTSESSTARKLILEVQKENDKLSNDVKYYQGHSNVINSLSLEQCNELEKTCKETLERVEKRKVKIFLFL